MSPSSKQRGVQLALGALAVFLALVLATYRRGRLTPARPEAVPDAPLLDAQPASTFDVPVTISYRRLQTLIERSVPTQWVEDSVGTSQGGPRVAIAVTRGSFAVSYGDGAAVLSTTLSYAVRTSLAVRLLPDVPISCGVGEKAAPRMDVQIRSPISLTPDWRLDAHTQVAYLAPTSDRDRDRCEVTFLSVDITDRVRDGMRSYFVARTPELDSLIRSVDLRSSFERWWTMLGSPVMIGPDMWLEMHPERISYGRVTGDGTSITALARLTARPRIRLGGRPTLAPPPPLPALERDTVRQSAFLSVVDGIADYGEIGRALTSLIGGSTVEELGRSLTVDSISVWGVGRNRMGVEVSVEGDVSGTLYFVGGPTYDASTGTVRLPDLSMTVETSDVVTRGASWILSSGLEAILRDRARWPVDRGVEWAAGEMNRGLNARLDQGVYLRGELDGLEVTDVAARASGLLVRARVSGEVALSVDAS